MVQTIWKILAVSYNTKFVLANPAIALLGICHRNENVCLHTKTLLKRS